MPTSQPPPSTPMWHASGSSNCMMSTIRAAVHRPVNDCRWKWRISCRAALPIPAIPCRCLCGLRPASTGNASISVRATISGTAHGPAAPPPPPHEPRSAGRDSMKKWLPGALLLGIACLPLAQDWPVAKPIRLIVAYPAGGVSDQMARALADKLTVQLGTPVLVENKAGAGGSLGVDAVAKAAADGYTLGFAAISPLSLDPHLGSALV